MLLGVVLATVALLSSRVCSQETETAFTKEVQGDWHVLAAHQNNTNIATGKRVGSRVVVAADEVTWQDPEVGQSPLVNAKCARAAGPAESKKSVDPNELTSTVSGSLCAKQGATLSSRWRVTDNNVLLLLVEVAEYKGNRNGNYSGAAPTDVILICQRERVPLALKPDPEADAKAERKNNFDKFYGFGLIV